MALRAPTVQRSQTFRSNFAALRKGYPQLRKAVQELERVLKESWGILHLPIDPKRFPGVYGVALDYEPKGSAGLGVLFLTYHASPLAANPMSEPLRRYTLLTLTERQLA